MVTVPFSYVWGNSQEAKKEANRKNVERKKTKILKETADKSDLIDALIAKWQ